MDSELEDIVHRMQVTKLESKLALREIEHESIKRELAARRMTAEDRVAALERCDELQSECAQLQNELHALRQPRQ